MFTNSQNTMLSCVYQSNINIKWLQEILQQLDGDYSNCAVKYFGRLEARDYSKCAIKIPLCLGALSVRASNHRSPRSSLSTIPYSRKNQRPTRKFLLRWTAKQITAVSVPYCTSENENLLLFIGLCMPSIFSSIN